MLALSLISDDEEVLLLLLREHFNDSNRIVPLVQKQNLVKCLLTAQILILLKEIFPEQWYHFAQEWFEPYLQVALVTLDCVYKVGH